MNSLFVAFISANNYLNDIAVLLLLASGIAMRIIIRKVGDRRDGPIIDYFIDMVEKTTFFARFSIYGLLISSIPRMIAFKKFEWENAVEAHHVSYLLARHIIAFIAAYSGIYLWVKLTTRIREIKGQAKTA
ncbi:MAG: hypothetical protein HZA11_13030 [Nitrospirae bacterium]|nr:hypothetical protein [Nitrospirota bacterium]